jgi:hypothetical protein
MFNDGKKWMSMQALTLQVRPIEIIARYFADARFAWLPGLGWVSRPDDGERGGGS